MKVIGLIPDGAEWEFLHRASDESLKIEHRGAKVTIDGKTIGYVLGAKATYLGLEVELWIDDPSVLGSVEP